MSEDRILEATTLAQIAKIVLARPENYLKYAMSQGDYSIEDAPGFHTPTELMELAIGTGRLDQRVKDQLNNLIIRFSRDDKATARSKAIEAWLKANPAAERALTILGNPKVTASKIDTAIKTTKSRVATAADIQRRAAAL